MPTSPTRISLARIRELQVPVSWQEAVAVARAAGDVSLGTGHGGSLDTCHVTTSGAVEIAGGSRQNGSLRNPVFSLLAALLDGRPAPDALRALVASQKPDSNDVLMDFLSEDEPQPDSGQLHNLSFFARPNPDRLIAALASRGLAAAAEYDASRAVEELRVEADEPLQPEEVAQPEWSLSALRDWARRRQPLALGAVAALIVAGTAWLVSSRPAAGTTMQAAEAETADVGAPRAHESAAGSSEVTVPPPAVPEAATTAAGPSTSRDRTSRSAVGPLRQPAAPIVAAVPGTPAVNVPTPLAATAAAGPVLEAPAATDLRLMNLPARDPAPLPATSVIPDVAAESIAGERSDEAMAISTNAIYSAQDADVLPPVLLRPQISSERRIDTEPSDAEIELVVNADGVVTQVRLRSSGELSLNDRMLVAAAKAWQFRPAVKDGRPVSYTLRIPVTP